MKKLLSIALSVFLLLSLWGCSETEENDTGLQIGYARESIMPDGSVNLSGYANDAHRISTGYLDYIYATCIAASQGGNTVLLFSMDLLNSNKGWTEEAREQISQATGVPAGHIMFSSTHTHSAPVVGGGQPLVQQWKTVFMSAVVTAAKKALEDQAPATLYGASVQTENMTYVRHYKMTDGSYAGDNFGDRTKTFDSHATEANEEMVLIKMDRPEEKKDIVLMNFQAHPCFTGGTTNISADFVGATRDAFEAETNMHFIYFTGSAGNQNTNSRLASDTPVSRQGKAAYSAKLVEYATAALENATPLGNTGVQVCQRDFTYPCNKYGQDRLAEAMVVSKAYAESGDTTTAGQLATQYGFQSVFEASGIVNCANWPDEATMSLNVVKIGDMAFVAAPYEMFSTSAFAIRDGSPFPFTVLASLANEHHNYFPSQQAYDYICYESFTAKFAAGVAEATEKQFVEMLNSLT